MEEIMRFPRVGVGAAAILSLGAAVVLSSCTCKIKDEQLASIRQLRTEEKQLTADIEKAERDKTRISGELSSRQNDVRKCNEQKAFVQDKLAKWPDNVWPDYNPNAVPAPTEPVKTDTKKKR